MGLEFMRRLFFGCFLLIVALVLSACANNEKVVLENDPSQVKGSAKQARNSKMGSDKATPFADEIEKRTVYFSLGGVSIDSEGAERLSENAQKIKEDPHLIVTLVGHTDNLGSAAYNLAVADRRIDSVINRLRSLGVPKNQIRRLPRGSDDSSKLKCEIETCRRLMRKVELVYERR